MRSLFEARLADRPDNEARAGALADFLREGRVRDWTVLEPTSMTSTGKATLTAQSDGSILVGGNNPDKDAYRSMPRPR